MASKFFLFIFLSFSSFLHLGFTDPASDLLALGLRDGALAAAQNKMQCLARLLPCEPFLKSATNPPKACCMPLQEMATNETDCLCSFFNNPDILKALQVTQEEALKLPAACEIHVDVYECNINGALSAYYYSILRGYVSHPSNVATPTASPASILRGIFSHPSNSAIPTASPASSPVATREASPAATPTANPVASPAPGTNIALSAYYHSMLRGYVSHPSNVATPTASPASMLRGIFSHPSNSATPTASPASSPVATREASPAATPTANPAASPAPGTNTITNTAPADATEGSTSPTSSTSKITPYGITGFGVPGFAALLIALVLSAIQA